MNQKAREVSNAKGEGNDGERTHALESMQREFAKENWSHNHRTDNRGFRGVLSSSLNILTS